MVKDVRYLGICADLILFIEMIGIVGEVVRRRWVWFGCIVLIWYLYILFGLIRF